MKFDKPAGENPIDQLKVVGRPHDRIDGPLKTTGTARYAYEWHEEAPNAAYGYIVGSAIAKGRLTALDTDAAQKAPGVLAVITASNAGALGKGDKNTARLLGGPTIEHYHQAIALVVAETFEQARAAASLVQAHYRRNKGAYSLADEKQAVSQPPEDTPDKNVGDFDGAFTSAAVKIDATYTTPDQSHMAMEPHASMAVWDGNKLTLWTSNQMIDWCRTDLAKTLKVPVENVRIISPYIGGGFGGKLFLRSDALLAALAARAVKRPVKVMLPRPTIPNNTTHRPATLQHLRIGADQSGKITAISHESWSGNLPGGTPETAVQQSEFLYAGANRHTGLRLATLDLPEGNAMRAPGEAPGLMALEIAIDELAEKAGIDPVEFRILNDTQVDPADPTRSTFAGHFVEVGVHSATGEVRVRRMLAVCAAGRILNPKTARSQVIGAMTMGMGAALMEELAVDDRLGYFVNHDMAGYEVPVHADIPKQEVIFLDDTDPISSPMKAKGVGELGLCGVSAAIANAVYNATGIRVRDYPITLDKLLDKLPDVV
ncbi:xanthine dehydrogenase family protein molybdopterin-binding subunit [Escherichia coli]